MSTNTTTHNNTTTTNTHNQPSSAARCIVNTLDEHFRYLSDGKAHNAFLLQV